MANSRADVANIKAGAAMNKGNRGHVEAIHSAAKAMHDHAADIISRTSQMMPDPDQTSEAENYPAESGAAKTDGYLPMFVQTQIIEGAIKAAGDWTLDVLGVPFGGPFNGRDMVGEKFTPRTKVHEDIYHEIPVFYYHGYDENFRPQGDPIIIGKATYDHVDNSGHWYKVILDKAQQLAERVWEAAKAGTARASSGTIAHILRKTQDGEITNWPVVEMTLTDRLTGKLQAANAYAVAYPAAKATFEKAGLTLVVPSDEDVLSVTPEIEGKPEAVKTAVSEIKVGEEVEPTTQKEHEMTEDLITKEMLQQAVKEGIAEGIKTFQASLPAKDTAGISVTLDEADRPFKSLAEMAFAVKTAAVSAKNGSVRMDARLLRIESGMKAAQGANESIPADAGYLIEPTISTELIKPIHEEGPFSSAVRRLPVGSNSNFGYINGIDETSRATGSRWGGVRGYRINEGETITASRPKFRRVNWELHKYAALMYATDELIMDAAQFNAVASQSAGEEIAFMVNDDIVNGLGVGRCQGVLLSPALVTVSYREDVNKISHTDVLKMWQRMLPRNKKNAKWFCNSDVIPALNALYFTGTTSVLSPFVSYGQDGSMKLFGKEVVETEFNPSLATSGGAAGDLLLADFSDYLFWDKGDVQAATSIHIAFLTDEQAFRFVYRCDGQTAWASPITPYKGSLTQSAFVVLSAASS
ncbi:putative Phage major capsid protein [Gammaproteobacteria bacterium]